MEKKRSNHRQIVVLHVFIGTNGGKMSVSLFFYQTEQQNMMNIHRRLEEIMAHGAAIRPLSTATNLELLNGIEHSGRKLLNAELGILRIQLQDQINSEIILTRRLIIGSAIIILGCASFIFGILIELSKFVPVWLSALFVGIFLCVAGWSVIVLAWKRQKSLAQFQSELMSQLF